MSHSRLRDVVLAISAFRSDANVIELLKRACRPGTSFGAVVVVDSLGSGAIAKAIAEHGWPVDYVNADRNLGSAGNLDLRLRTAANSGLGWCLTLNHDGELDLEKAERLLLCGAGSPDIGAVYPRLKLTQAGGRVDGPRRSFVPQAGKNELPAGDSDVAWGSSNGALYRLDAVRSGLRTWPELWMGYEDLAIGWELASHGWRQVLCGSVEVADNYEYRSATLLGRRLEIVEKPPWYSYYQLRNLWLIHRQTGGKAIGFWALGRRAFLDIAIIALWKDSKRKRLGLLLKGLADGLRNRDGKGPVP